jgi:hypothetical protein
MDEQMRPFAPSAETWDSLPGVDRITAWTMVAEMVQIWRSFPSPCTPLPGPVCPGQQESAGKRQSGQTRKGNVWLRQASLRRLGQPA